MPPPLPPPGFFENLPRAAVKDAEEWADEYELKYGIRIFAKGERACVNITRQS